MQSQLFHFGHVALYAKGHYKKQSKYPNIWGDIARCLLEDQGFDLDNRVTPNDITNCIVSQLERMDLIEMKPFILLNAISPSNYWRYGCDRNKYDYHEAILRYCLSIIRYLDLNQIKMVEPLDYVLPLTKANKDLVENIQ